MKKRQYTDNRIILDEPSGRIVSYDSPETRQKFIQRSKEKGKER